MDKKGEKHQVEKRENTFCNKHFVSWCICFTHLVGRRMMAALLRRTESYSLIFFQVFLFIKFVASILCATHRLDIKEAEILKAFLLF